MDILVSYMYMQDPSHHSSKSYEGRKSKGSGLGPELWKGRKEVSWGQDLSCPDQPHKD